MYFLTSILYCGFSTKWQKGVELIGNKCEGRCPDLAENTKYQFRVIAVNKAGQSKPSEPSDPVLIKDRYGEYYFIFLQDIDTILLKGSGT